MVKSVQYLLTQLFVNPMESSGFAKSFNIYGEAEMKRAGLPNSNWSGMRPYIFIVDAGARFAEQQRPGITIDWQGSMDTSFELGNVNNLKNMSMLLRIVGRTRGEAMDFARYIANNLTMVNIYDYDQAGDPPPLLEGAATLEDIIIEKVEPNDADAIHGSFAHQVNISFGIPSFNAA